MVVYAAATGGTGWAVQIFGDGVINGVHCADGAAGGGAHIALFDNVCLLY